MDYIVYLLASFIAVMLVVTIHEFAHAFVAYKCGDPTAKFAGRMTLNPIKHFDLTGVLFFAVAGFGWAKPVPVNPNNFKNYKWGSFFTSIAGVAVNYLSAFLFYGLYMLVARFVAPVFAGKYMATFLVRLPFLAYSYSISFAVFNLLPFYPLDGFRMWDALDRKRGKALRFLRNYGYYILIGLIAINFLSQYVPFLGYINLLGYAMHYISVPITALWGWIFGI